MVKSKRAREAVEVDEKPVAAVEQTEVPAKKRKRSDDEPASGDVKKKAKKDKKKDKESRKERKDKRKNLLDLPEEEADEEEQKTEAAEPEKMDVDVTTTATEKPKKEKKQKKDKKEKKNRDKEDKVESDDKEKKEKKEKKDKKKKSKTVEPEENGNAKPAEDVEENGEAEGKADRHIVFVGNLPYSATVESITAHFASLSPVSVRCLTKREDPTACRGIAFVEFGKVWHMRTCLDKLHHSMFDDGVSPARKINIELTAGGGGKTKQRSEKIKEKNIKLDENRAKRIEKEKTAKEESKASGGAQPQKDHFEDNIHPSRRARVPGQKW